MPRTSFNDGMPPVTRMVANLVVLVIANAVGLIVAAWLLEDMALSAGAFLLAVALFTAVEIVAQPLIIKIGWKYLRALTGASALVATFVALVITTIIADGMDISGVVTWVLATVIVWAAALVAALVLPLFVFKQVLGARRDQAGQPTLR
jgi:hypothetical protein